MRGEVAGELVGTAEVGWRAWNDELAGLSMTTTAGRWF